MDVARLVPRAVNGVLVTAAGDVARGRHDREFTYQNEEGDEDREAGEEVGRLQGVICGLVPEAVEEVDRRAGVKGARDQRHDEPRAPREGVGELVRADEEEGPAQAEEEVTHDVPVEVAQRLAQVEGQGHAAAAEEEDHRREDVARAPPVAVQNPAAEHVAHVQRDGGEDEHQVQAHVLLRAGQLALVLVRGRPVCRAEGPIDPLSDEDRLEGCEAADYP